MSRSYRKPYSKFGDSDKEDKQKANRKFRRVNKYKMNYDDEENLYHNIRETTDIWSFRSEGLKPYNKNSKAIRK